MLINEQILAANLTKGYSTNMKSKSIVLWGREDLLSSSVELFLTNEKCWNVVSISNQESLDELIRTVDKLTPDVVIIQQGDLYSNLNLPAKLLQDHPGLRVIVINPHDNLMEVYSKQNFMATSASDLLSVVEADPVINNGKHSHKRRNNSNNSVYSNSAN